VSSDDSVFSLGKPHLIGEKERESMSLTNTHQGFSYGLIDTLNKHFQVTLGITRARSSGLQAAYFGAYPLASLGHANWLLRHWGYKATFIWGLTLYGIGSLIAWPCLVYRSFGGFCAAIFVIGNGLGSLETAANPYLAGAFGLRQWRNAGQQKS
jgi:fucose permease